MRRVVIFLKNAGPLILGISLVVWFATTFPNYDNPNASERVSESYAAKVGPWVAPVFEPMGLDWKVGTAVIVSFSAREVFVPTLTLLLGQDVTETSGVGTFEQWRSLKATSGQPLFSTASMVALLVFFMVALQCTSTVAIIAKETNSWRRALWQFVIMNCLAYAFAVMVYRILSGV
jgi:ferrous iron transport protein B